MILLNLLQKARIKTQPVETDMDQHRAYLKKQGSSNKVVYSHRGVNFPEGKEYIFWVNIKGYSFLYVVTPDREEYIYYFPSKEDVVESLGQSGDGTFIYGVDVSTKKYCFEIKITIAGDMYINYITTVPEGCGVGLKKLFEVAYLLLSTIGYKGKIALKDDVQIDGKFITFDRIKQGKPSIYSRYGFRIIPEREIQIQQAKNKGDMKLLKELCHNIPMVAKDISQFVD